MILHMGIGHYGDPSFESADSQAVYGKYIVFRIKVVSLLLLAGSTDMPERSIFPYGLVVQKHAKILLFAESAGGWAAIVQVGCHNTKLFKVQRTKIKKTADNPKGLRTRGAEIAGLHPGKPWLPLPGAGSAYLHPSTALQSPLGAEIAGLHPRTEKLTIFV